MIAIYDRDLVKVSPSWELVLVTVHAIALYLNDEIPKQAENVSEVNNEE